MVLFEIIGIANVENREHTCTDIAERKQCRNSISYEDVIG